MLYLLSKFYTLLINISDYSTKQIMSIVNKCKPRGSLKLEESPYNNRFKRKIFKPSTHLDNSINLKPQTKLENSIVNPKVFLPIEKYSNYQKKYEFSEKAKSLTSRLAYMLSLKSSSSTEFQIYSKVYQELAEYLDDFKDILETLRKGLVIFGIKNKDSPEFEFKIEINASACDLGIQLDKEKKEKSMLINKLNSLSAENLKLSEKQEITANKCNEYEKIIHKNPSMFIDAEKLLDKMMKQCEIIRKQQIYIHELQASEMKLNKLIQKCEEKGFNVIEFCSDNNSGILNPHRQNNKRLKKSRTLSGIPFLALKITG